MRSPSCRRALLRPLRADRARRPITVLRERCARTASPPRSASRSIAATSKATSARCWRWSSRRSGGSAARTGSRAWRSSSCASTLAQRRPAASAPRSPGSSRSVSRARATPGSGDVAALEWAWQECLVAPDPATTLDVTALAGVGAERAARLRLLPHPALRLVESRGPCSASGAHRDADGIRAGEVGAGGERDDGATPIDLDAGGEAVKGCDASTRAPRQRCSHAQCALAARALASGAPLGEPGIACHGHGAALRCVDGAGGGRRARPVRRFPRLTAIKSVALPVCWSMRRVAASSTTPNLELPKMNRKNAILATALGGLLALIVATQAQAAEDAGVTEKCARRRQGRQERLRRERPFLRRPGEGRWPRPSGCSCPRASARSSPAAPLAEGLNGRSRRWRGVARDSGPRHVDPTANPPDCARAVARSTATRTPMDADFRADDLVQATATPRAPPGAGSRTPWQPRAGRAAPMAARRHRLYVSWQFLKSGRSSSNPWETTLGLFRTNYRVPLLPPGSRRTPAPRASCSSPRCWSLGLFSAARRSGCRP